MCKRSNGHCPVVHATCITTKQVLLLLMVGCFASKLQATEKPNVLFVIVDDLTTTLSCQHWPAAETPHMDALAATGVRFDRAYCQFSVCNPARQSFLTGCYPQKTGVLDLRTSFCEALPDAVTLHQHFRSHGYRVGSIGKVYHIGDPKTQFDHQVGSYIHLDQKILEQAKTFRGYPKRHDGPTTMRFAMSNRRSNKLATANMLISRRCILRTIRLDEFWRNSTDSV